MTSLPNFSEIAATYKPKHMMNITLGILFAIILVGAFNLINPGQHLIDEVLSLVIFAMLFTFFMYLAEYRANYEIQFKTALKPISPDILAQLLDSPELDSQQKGFVTEYLNKNHPGWSLAQRSA